MGARQVQEYYNMKFFMYKGAIALRYLSNRPQVSMGYINNSRRLARKYGRIFVSGHYLFREANSFPTAKLEENCELRGLIHIIS